jgi:hypothetical protein
VEGDLKSLAFTTDVPGFIFAELFGSFLTLREVTYVV